jgi:hypothetical protein
MHPGHLGSTASGQDSKKTAGSAVAASPFSFLGMEAGSLPSFTPLDAGDIKHRMPGGAEVGTHYGAWHGDS